MLDSQAIADHFSAVPRAIHETTVPVVTLSVFPPGLNWNCVYFLGRSKHFADIGNGALQCADALENFG